MTGDLTPHYFSSSDVMESTTSNSPVNTDVSVTFTATGVNRYLVIACAEAGHSISERITWVYLSRGTTNLSWSRQRISRMGEPNTNENVCLIAIDTPPAGEVTYRIRFHQEGLGGGSAHINHKRLAVIKL